MNIPVLLAAASMTLAGTCAMAQTVYRCGPDGRTYTDQPCPTGRAIDAADPRSESQRREALAAARLQRDLAREMAAERRSREREAAAQARGPAGIARPAPVEFSPPDRGLQVPRRSDPKRSKRKAGAHVTWQAESPGQPQPLP